MTSVSVLSTAWACLDEALRTRRPVWVSYHGRRRLLCPHALGWRAARAMVLAYQTGGETSTGALDPNPTKRWRLLYVDEIDQVVAADPLSTWGSANNYNASHPFPIIDEIYRAVDCKSSPKQ
jgi:hypothetical protein